MTKQLTVDKRVTTYFKEYARKVMTLSKTTVLSECDMVYCLELALDKLALKISEDALMKLPPSKNDISRDDVDKMIKCLTVLAQWTDENTDECDEPWAASQARRVLDEIGVNKKIQKL